MTDIRMTGGAVAAGAGRREDGETRPVDWIAYLFVGLFAVPFLLFNVLPVLFGIYVSFTRWSIIGKPKWIGFDNYVAAFHDQWAIVAFENVLLYGLIIVPGVAVLALLFALFVNQRYPLSALARTLFFAPNVVSATVVGLVWVWLLDTQYGLLNHYLAYLGIDEIPWLTSTRWSLISVSMASIWWDLGLSFVLFLAALQDIPSDIIEAAIVDGAGRAQRFWFVILPRLRPIISMVITLQMISTLRIFSQVYVMTNGGPNNSSSSPISFIYNAAIVRVLFGYASAIGVLLFLLILVMTVFQRFVIRERQI
jgi:multiple sugar transport system permease protein